MTSRATKPNSASVARADATAALAAWQRGEATPAEALRILWPVVRDAADHSNLGALLRALGKSAEAASAYRRAIALDPKFAAAHYNLGNLLCDAGGIGDAEAAYRAALAARPDYPEALNALGTVLQRRGKLADAAEAFRAAAQRAPRWVEPQTNLGVALLGLERYDAAQKALQAAIAIDPSHANAHGNLGAVYLRAGCPVAAEQATCDAIKLAPNEHRWITNLAVALQMQGRHAETEVCHRHALTLRPDYASGHGNLLFALNYRDDLSAEAIFAEYRNWDARHARDLASDAPFELDRTEGRRLRVGFVSPDFRQHAVALFTEPLLAALDRDAMELFCYAEVPVEDATTARFRALADHWRPTVGLEDEDTGGADPPRPDRRAGGHGRPLGRQPAAGLRPPASSGADRLSAGSRLHLRPVGNGRLPGRRRAGAAGRRGAVQRAADPPAAAALRLSAARRNAAGGAAPGRQQRLSHLRLFRPAGAAECRRRRHLVAHPARDPHGAPGAEQPILPGTRLSPPVPRPLHRARHRPRPAGR